MFYFVASDTTDREGRLTALTMPCNMYEFATFCNCAQDEGLEPACALLVTLRPLKVYIWAGVLYGNILFRFYKKKYVLTSTGF